jgi:hypothetical protein
VNARTPPWNLFGQSAKGAHKHANQDRHGWQSFQDDTELILAVADGHGSSAHPRSDTGAELAVGVFLEAAADLRPSIHPDEHLKQIKARAEQDLPRNVIRTWQQRVEQHLADHPPPDREPDAAPAAVLYGTTIVGALISDTLVIGWQLGDGDLCFINADGQVTTPLRQDTQTLGDETDSLCSGNAALLMHTHWRPNPGADTPVLVALSTDGLSNSFISFDSYLEFLSGLHHLLRTEGAEKVKAEIPGWLHKASSFSGDDATLVVAWRELN